MGFKRCLGGPALMNHEKRVLAQISSPLLSHTVTESRPFPQPDRRAASSLGGPPLLWAFHASLWALVSSEAGWALQCPWWAALFVVGSSTWLPGNIVSAALPFGASPAVSVGRSVCVMIEILKTFSWTTHYSYGNTRPFKACYIITFRRVY